MASELTNGGDPADGSFPTGPEVGELLPTISLPDQHGTMITHGPTDGKAMVIFYRSASW